MAAQQSVAQDAPARLHVQLIRAIYAAAVMDASRVARFLKWFRQVCPNQPSALDADALLALAAVLRLMAWEDGGLTIHRDAGLPPWHEALAEVHGQGTGAAGTDLGRDLSLRVLKVIVRNFAWHDLNGCQPMIVLDVLNDDASLDALAEFLWNHRDRRHQLEA